MFYFKGDFAQPFSEQLGENLQDKNWSTKWFTRLSSVCKSLVYEDGFTYWEGDETNPNNKVEYGEVMVKGIPLASIKNPLDVVTEDVHTNWYR